MNAAFEVTFDRARNVVRLLFRGRLTGARLTPELSQLESALAQVRQGFSALADFVDVISIDLDCAPALARILDLCRDRGLGKLVRVLPDASKDIGLNILAAIHLRGQVPMATFGTLREAEHELGPPVLGLVAG